MLMNGLLILSGKLLILGLAYSSPVVLGWVRIFFVLLMNIWVLIMVVIAVEVGNLLIW